MVNEKRIDYADIARVNAEIETVNIKGKQYAQVKDRIDAFRKLYPGGGIATELLQMGEIAIIKATVTDGSGAVLGTGHAYEREGSTNINKTSYLENCETSAVGRALSMCGIGIANSVASAEEVRSAQAQQDALEHKPLDATQLRALQYKCTRAGVDINDICADYGVEKPEDLTVGILSDLALTWEKRYAK